MSSSFSEMGAQPPYDPAEGAGVNASLPDICHTKLSVGRQGEVARPCSGSSGAARVVQ